MNALVPRLGVLVRSAAFIALHVRFQALFVIEIALSVGAHGTRPMEFFRDG